MASMGRPRVGVPTFYPTRASMLAVALGKEAVDMRIGELAGQFGLNSRTIRFYESIGVLPGPARTSSGYRDYDESYLERLRFIKLAQSLGLSLDDIREILALRDRGEAPCSYVRWVIEEQAAAIEQRIRELERLRSDLQKLRRVAQSLPDESPDDRCVCHILENDRLADPQQSA